MALVLVVAGLAVAVAGSLVPVSGDGVTAAGSDVRCGPALGALLGWTGPAAADRPPAGAFDPDDFVPTEPGSDTGHGAAAWCEFEAAGRLAPSAAVALGLLAMGGAAWVAGRAAAGAPRRLPVAT